MGLAVNEANTKYMLSTSGVVPRMWSQITANSYNFDVVKEFIYLGTAINTNNDVNLEIKRRVTLANRCYLALNRQLSSRDLSNATKLTLYKALILPVLLYGAEARTLSSTDAAALAVFERNVLRKIFGPVRVGELSTELSTVSEPTGSCMSSAMTWTLLSVLISSGSAGSALSFGWMKKLLRDEYLMRWSSAAGTTAYALERPV